jgi:hypothetical protein
MLLNLVFGFDCFQLLYVVVVTGSNNVGDEYNSISNISNIKTELSWKYPSIKKVKILYFHNKYIFTKIRREHLNKIIIRDFIK